MQIKVEVGTQSLLDRLQGMEQFAKTPRNALIEAGDVWLGQERAYLRSTAQWVPLRPKYAKVKLRRRGTTRPMIGGELERSLTRKGSRYHVRRIARQSIFIGTRDPVANIHNSGSLRRRIPPRMLIHLTRADRKELRDVFARHLMSARANASALAQRRRGL